MIYFDNSATTLQKPIGVSAAVSEGIQTFGNAGRGFYEPAMLSSRAIFSARQEIAKLVNLENALQVAFTSGATESINLVLKSLINPEDGVITTVLEHNSVLRPLYNIGCKNSFVDCDDSGNLLLDNLKKHLDRNSRFFVCTHGSNLLGNISDVKTISGFCKENGLIFILDIAQTLGCIEVFAEMADVLCFTGHKGLFGPQGTGGIIANDEILFRLVKTGGSGSDSFSPYQSLEMPDIFEAGTQNSHGLAGLQKGAEFINKIGIDNINKKGIELATAFLAGISKVKNIKIYGKKSSENRLPIVSLNVEGFYAEDLAILLWEKWKIVTRSGSHCAPLTHRRFGTQKNGMVRFSFSYFNTLEEIEIAVDVLKSIAK